MCFGIFQCRCLRRIGADASPMAHSTLIAFSTTLAGNLGAASQIQRILSLAGGWTGWVEHDLPVER